MNKRSKATKPSKTAKTEPAETQNEANATTIIGAVGPAGPEHVSGWALDTASMDEALWVIVEVNGAKLPAVEAKLPRKNLVESGYSNANHGFKVRVPKAVLERPAKRIRMWHEETPGTVFRSRRKLPPLEGAAEKGVAAKKKGGAKAKAKAAQVDTVKVADKAPKEGTPQIVKALTKALEERKKGRSIDWEKMADAGTAVVSEKALEGILLSAGRGCIYNKRYEEGLKLLSTCVLLFPKNSEALYYKAVLLSNAGEYGEAIELFEQLRPSGWKPQQTMLEHSKALVRAIDKSGHRADPELEQKFVEVVRALTAMDKGDVVYSPGISLRLAHCGEVDLALLTADRLAERRPNQPHGKVTKARILIEQERYDEGLELSQDILKKWPDNQIAAYHLRVYSGFSGSGRNFDQMTCAVLEGDGPDGSVRALIDGAPAEEPMSIADAVDLSFGLDWLIAADGDVTPDLDAWRDLFKTYPRAGCIDLPEGNGSLWRVEALRNLVESELVDLTQALSPQLATWRSTYLDRAVVEPRHGGQALLMSRYGASKFGGAEHTMASLSAYYREGGRTTVLGGTSLQVEEKVDLGPNQKGDRVPEDANALRRYILTNGFDVVHAISGMGFQVAQALAFTNISMIYGIYYWRDVLGKDGLETFFDDDEKPIPRAEFKYILLQAQTVFVNSKYTRGIIEAAHNIRLPIVYSIPEEIDQ